MESQLSGRLRRGAALLTASALTAAGLVTGGALFAPTDAANAAAGDATVSNATLTWGVKASFRNYIYNFAAFEGKSTLLGTATQDAAEGPITWSGGSGTAAADGSAADVDFGTGNGIHFQSHPMDGAYALDLQFLDPHVVVTSPSSAELRLDVIGHEFIGMTTVGPEYRLDDVTMATLDLSAGTASVADDSLTWTNVPATLTADGSTAFGGFYQEGETLDPVAFTLPIEAIPEEPAPSVERVTDAAVSNASAEEGLTVAVTGSGYVDLPLPTSGNDPAGVYIALRDAKTMSDEVINSDRDIVPAVTFLPTVAIRDGAFAQNLTIAPSDLDPAAEYEVIVWVAHGDITDETHVATEPIALTDDQRAALFPEENDGSDGNDEQVGDDDQTDDDQTGDEQAGDDQATPGTDAEAPGADKAPAKQQKPQITCTVENVAGRAGTPSLSWGVKSSFVSYIEGGIANGAISTSNGASRAGSGFLWGSGSGSVSDAGEGTVSFPGSVHFTGHDGVLNTTVSNLRVKATGSSSGTLVADVASTDMNGNNVGGSGIAFANLSFSSLSSSGGTASVSLSAAGAKAFAGFYSAGQAMDSLTVSFSGARKASTEQVCYDENGNRVNPDGTPYTGGPAVNTGGYVTAADTEVPAGAGWGMLGFGLLLTLLVARRILVARR